MVHPQGPDPDTEVVEENSSSPVDANNEEIPPYLREEPPEGKSCALILYLQGTNNNNAK